MKLIPCSFRLSLYLADNTILEHGLADKMTLHIYWLAAREQGWRTLLFATLKLKPHSPTDKPLLTFSATFQAAIQLYLHVDIDSLESGNLLLLVHLGAQTPFIQ